MSALSQLEVVYQFHADIEYLLKTETLIPVPHLRYSLQESTTCILWNILFNFNLKDTNLARNYFCLAALQQGLGCSEFKWES